MNLFGLHFYLFPQMMNLLVGTFSNFFLPLLWVKYIETSLSDLTVWKHQHKAFKTQNPTFFWTISCFDVSFEHLSTEICYLFRPLDFDSYITLNHRKRQSVVAWTLSSSHSHPVTNKMTCKCLDFFIMIISCMVVWHYIGRLHYVVY